jgi:hypothetical protein
MWQVRGALMAFVLGEFETLFPEMSRYPIPSSRRLLGPHKPRSRWKLSMDAAWWSAAACFGAIVQ